MNKMKSSEINLSTVNKCINKRQKQSVMHKQYLNCKRMLWWQEIR